MSKKKATTTVSEALKQAIVDSGISLYRIAKDAEVGYASLHRFMNSERSVSMEVFDKLCGLLELELTPRSPQT